MKSLNRYWFYLLSLSPALAADTTPNSLASPKYGAWGFDASGMDRSVPPGSDFNRYANGNWEAKTEIPPDRTRFGYFDVLTVLSEARVHSILEDAAAGRTRAVAGASVAVR